MGDALVQKCRNLLDERALAIRAACLTGRTGHGGGASGPGWEWYAAQDLPRQAYLLYSCAGEVASAR